MAKKYKQSLSQRNADRGWDLGEVNPSRGSKPKPQAKVTTPQTRATNSAPKTTNPAPTPTKGDGRGSINPSNAYSAQAPIKVSSKGGTRLTPVQSSTRVSPVAATVVKPTQGATAKAVKPKSTAVQPTSGGTRISPVAGTSGLTKPTRSRTFPNRMIPKGYKWNSI